MLPRNHPDRIHVAFDDHRLNAGLLLPATLALHLGLPHWLTGILTWAAPQAEPILATRSDPGGLRPGRGRLHRRR